MADHRRRSNQKPRKSRLEKGQQGKLRHHNQMLLRGPMKDTADSVRPSVHVAGKARADPRLEGEEAPKRSTLQRWGKGKMGNREALTRKV